MKTNTYRIADTNIKITSLFDDVHILCKNYLTEGIADFSVSTSLSDIAIEREKSEMEDELEGVPKRNYFDNYLEELAVYRKIAEQMVLRDTILFHGSAIAVDGEAYLFIAKSGTGKSTHTRLWRNYFGSRAVMVNDDKPLIRVADTGAIVYGTPWDGKHHLSNNISVPLRAICILERAEDNRIRKISVSEAYTMLLQQVYRPATREATMKTLVLIDKLSTSVGLYRLGCNMNIEAAEVAYTGMR